MRIFSHPSLFLLSSTILLTTAGCATVSDCSYELTQKIRTQKSWEHYDTGGTCYSLAYRNGWKAGHYDVLTGGDGCPPIFAPECYSNPLKVVFHCDEPRQEWYIGFQDGAACAQQSPDTHYLKPWLPAMAETACRTCPSQPTATCENQVIPYELTVPDQSFGEVYENDYPHEVNQPLDPQIEASQPNALESIPEQEPMIEEVAPAVVEPPAPAPPATEPTAAPAATDTPAADVTPLSPSAPNEPAGTTDISPRRSPLADLLVRKRPVSASNFEVRAEVPIKTVAFQREHLAPLFNAPVAAGSK